VSIKDRLVGLCEQVLNVPIACRRYGPGKPGSWLSTEAVVGEKLGTDYRQAVDCVVSPSSCWQWICTNLLTTS
jgi:hypothetical protein